MLELKHLDDSVPAPAEEAERRLPGVLLPWFRGNARDLPWRKDRDPYHVWLSEIMLQQTRVEAVKGYYSRFLEAFPNLPALAAAGPERVSKLWEGLGYYARARNLQTAARQVMERHGGVFPTDLGEIRALKGIGAYTAGAIASICFGQPTPAVDGNVLRVMARITGDESPVNEASTKAAVEERLRKIYPPGHCGEFTQALMELGAVVCLPNGAPDCPRCPAGTFCAARDGAWKRLPVKAPKKARRQEAWTVFYLYLASGGVALRKRPDQGLLAGLWELPNVSGHLSLEQAVRQAESWGVKPEKPLWEAEKRHIFTHVEWDMRCYAFSCGGAGQDLDFIWADRTALERDFALPTAFRKFLHI